MTKNVYGIKFQDGDVKEMNEKYRYSLVVAQHLSSDKEGRLHLCRLYDSAMWRLFTVAQRGTEVKEGFYLCRVVEFRLDRNAYTNLVVAPMAYLGKDEVRFSPVWEYLRSMMSVIAFGGRYGKKFNTEDLLPATDSLERLMEKGEDYYHWMSSQMMEPSYAAKVAKEWQESFSKDEFRTKYPLLAAKYATPEGDAAHELERRAEFLTKTFKAMGENMKACSTQEVFHKCESLMEKRKAKRVANRKAKKG